MNDHHAFDLGLRRTGHAYPGGSDVLICPAGAKGDDRLRFWRSTFRTIMSDAVLNGCDAVVVEGTFLGGNANRGRVQTIHLHGVFRCVAADHHLRVVEIAPSSLKKAATGNGRASKEEMVAAARALGCDPADDNEADAFHAWIWHADRRFIAGATSHLISTSST